jgi:DNA polymerase-3 subunit delta
LIDEELAAAGLRITADARSALQECLGGDRIASRNEVRKLALYARDEGLIEEHHVAAIVGDASAISADDAVDSVLKGDLAGFHHAIQKVVTSKTPVFLVLQGCLRQLQLLDLMRSEMDGRRASIQDAINAHGRHLHFRRKPAMESALRNLSSAAIATEMSRLQNAILQSRQRASLEDTIAMQALLATTLIAGRGQKRR